MDPKHSFTKIVIEAEYPLNQQRIDNFYDRNKHKEAFRPYDKKEFGLRFSRFKNVLISTLANGMGSVKRIVVPLDIKRLILDYSGQIYEDENEYYHQRALHFYGFMGEKLYLFVRTQSAANSMWFADNFEKFTKLVFEYYFDFYDLKLNPNPTFSS